ncbi:MAG: hypothetical protein EU533_02630 [Promethearchaeota archaeon]|nr:MAG: hypothetical protein EU533_02630 [Candidatus Lokiarchaeota archaeon]
MRKQHKSFLINIIILLALGTFLSTLLNSSGNTNFSSPPDFYATSQEVDLNEFSDFLEENEYTVYLPKSWPNDYKLTAIYLKKDPFIAIVVYSAELNKDYKTAELTYQISIVTSTPTHEELSQDIQDPSIETVYEINGWPMLLNEEASSGGESSFVDKYGEFTVLTMLWIESCQYMINSPNLTPEEVITLVENMSTKSL